VGDYPVRFFHFSGFDSGANALMIEKYSKRDNCAIYKLRRLYVDLIEGFGQKELGKVPWSYNYYSNNSSIKKHHRLLYRSQPRLQLLYKNPYDVESTPSFYHFVRYRDLVGAGILCELWQDNGRELLAEARGVYRQGGVKSVIKKIMTYLARKLYRTPHESPTT
jgi:hypothetical protein